VGEARRWDGSVRIGRGFDLANYGLGPLTDHFHGERIVNEVGADQVEFAEANFRVEISDGVD
jgi:hypothetical protein